MNAAAARDYVELERLEHAPGPVQLQEWKDAPNWLFRKHQEHAQALTPGVPPLARADLGKTGWERRLIERIRGLHLAWRKEKTYRAWLWRWARFRGRQPLESASGEDLKRFLTHLAVEERVGVATQRQALNAGVFFLREVERKEPGDLSDFIRARPRTRVPVVLSRAECERLFAAMEGTVRLMAELMYGGGLRLLELLRLRVKDVDLDRHQLIVRGGKGDQDRVTVLPERLRERLAAHRERLRRLHTEDREKGLPGVWLPEALERKWPQAGESWEWQWFWPSRQLAVDPRSGLKRRHHVLDATFQDLLGHQDVATTQIYTHVMRKPGLGVTSPLDGWD